MDHGMLKKCMECLGKLKEFDELVKQAYANYGDSIRRYFLPEVASRKFADDLSKAFDPQIFPMQMILYTYSHIKKQYPIQNRYFHTRVSNDITNRIVMGASEEQLREIHRVDEYPAEWYDEEIIFKTTERLYIPENEWVCLNKKW